MKRKMIWNYLNKILKMKAGIAKLSDNLRMMNILMMRVVIMIKMKMI